jgi:hypothetical protein
MSDGLITPIEEWFRELVIDSDLARPRTLQREVGPSNLGEECERQLGYMSVEASRVNFSDPLKANIGTAFHALLAEILSHRGERYLVEAKVAYRGISGSVDLFDRYYGRVIDFKTTGLSKVKARRRTGAPKGHLIQGNMYGAGLTEMGESVRSITMLYIPTDGTLDDVFASTTPFDIGMADAAIDRLADIERKAREVGPESLTAKPSALCGWCSFHAPKAPLSPRTCPGRTAEILSAVDL